MIASIKRKYSITEKAKSASIRVVSQVINYDDQNSDNYTDEIPHYEFLNDFSAIDGNILECLLEKSTKFSFH